MASPLNISYKNSIMTKLTLQIADSVKSGTLPEDQLSPICQDVLDAVENPENQEAFFTNVVELTAKWPIFQPILEEMKKKAQAFSDVETMFDRNKQNGTVQ